MNYGLSVNIANDDTTAVLVL